MTTNSFNLWVVLWYILKFSDYEWRILVIRWEESKYLYQLKFRYHQFKVYDKICIVEWMYKYMHQDINK